MTSIPGGGPAFPTSWERRYRENDEWVSETGTDPGLTKRQWFAGMVLNGMLAHPTRYRPRPGAPANWHEAIAQEAFEIADALLAAEGEKS